MAARTAALALGLLLALLTAAPNVSACSSLPLYAQVPPGSASPIVWVFFQGPCPPPWSTPGRFAVGVLDLVFETTIPMV